MTVLDDSMEPFFLGQHHSFLLEEEGPEQTSQQNMTVGRATQIIQKNPNR